MNEAFHQAFQAGSELIFIPKLVKVQNKLNDMNELAEGRGLRTQRTMQENQYGRDTVEIQVAIYEVKNRRMLDVVKIQSYSEMFANAGKGPSSLFEEAAIKFVKSITYGQHIALY